MVVIVRRESMVPELIATPNREVVSPKEMKTSGDVISRTRSQIEKLSSPLAQIALTEFAKRAIPTAVMTYTQAGSSFIMKKSIMYFFCKKKYIKIWEILVKTCVISSHAEHRIRFCYTKNMTLFNFKNIHLFARRYLETYYLDVNEDEPPIARFLLKKFKKLPKINSALEIGCGPTIHHALPIAPYVDAIDMADYLPENLTEIKKWQEGHSEAFSWNHYTEMVLREEGEIVTKGKVIDRENLLRKKIRSLNHCDITKLPPLSLGTRYPVVLTFYCAEEVGANDKSWQMMMNNISIMVAPEGYLFLSALRDTTKYILGDINGDHEWLPCARVTEQSLRHCLEKIGFLKESIDICSVDTPGLAILGIPGILVASAKKSQC